MRLPLLHCVKITVLVLFILGILAFYPSNRINVQSSVDPELPTFQHIDEPILYDAFQIREDAYNKQLYKVKARETFSDILSRHGISNLAIAKLVNRAKPVMDVRKIRAGNTYTMYKDSTMDRTEIFVYEQDAVNFVVFDLRDSLHVERRQRSVRTIRKRVAGVIKSSLYETLSDIEANPLVAIELSEIFAWQVDFYRIMKGDRFSVIYEERFVADQSVGVEKIIAAQFEHNGDTYTAFPYEIDGHIQFYDHEGNSLRRPFLKAPLRFSRISSRYSLRRFHPVQKRYKAHLGTDYAAPTGTPVRATADGVVVNAGYTRGNGRYVKVKHNGTYTTGYLHFSRIAKGIKKGVRVKQGDVIGYVGSTGLATGPHLCYRFWKNGKQVDPLREKLPDTIEPIKKAYLIDFKNYVARLKPALEHELGSDHFTPIVQQPSFEDLTSMSMKEDLNISQ